MSVLRNAVSLLSSPVLARDFVSYNLSRLRNRGEAIRDFRADRIKIGGLSGFGEFHSCAYFISQAERRFLTQFPLESGPAVDVGGNLGIFSLVLARLFPDRLIYTFEPNPHSFKSMRENLVRNRCTNVLAFPQAVADHTGEVPFLADPVDRATVHVVPKNPAPGDSAIPVVRVPCITLDSLVETQRLSSIALLKVDVEGYEEMVFTGAEKLLSQGVAKTIFYEVCPILAREAGYAPEDASRRLLRHGYRLYCLDSYGQIQPANLDRICEASLENWVAIWNGSGS